MRSGTLKVLLVAALVVAVAARPEHFGGRRKGGFVQFHKDEPHRVLDSRLDSDVSGIARIEQKIDHFNASDARTFKQRYFWNNGKSSNKRSNVNILYLSGEQTASLNMISGNTKPIMEYADKFAANLYALEHRYYGDSRPFLTTDTENLKYLSSRQAIEDIAAFIKLLNANSGAPTAQKWVVVGGSYAGNLAAWARLKHPELIAGSIASSAPLLAQLDFYGYLQTVDANLPAACRTQVQKGMDGIGKLLESANGRATLDKKFPISPKIAAYKDLQDNDIALLYAYAMDVFEGASQYGTPASVGQICNEFLNHPINYDPVDALADLIRAHNKPGFTMDINYTAAYVQMQDTTYDDDGEENFTDRLWTYQTCTEFGYFQSTDRGTNVFGSTVPVNLYIDFCKDAFDIDVDAVKKSIDDTNAYYGERDYYTGTNVFFAHGTVDPWSFLTKQATAQHWSVIIAEVAGGTHCQDLAAACNAQGVCNPVLQKVQNLHKESIDQWLNGPFNSPDSVKLNDNVGKRPDWYNGFVPAPLSVKRNPAPDMAVIPRAERVAVAGSSTKKTKLNRGSGWNQFTGKRSHHLLPPPPKQTARRPDWPVNVEEAHVDQPWDHFDLSNDNQFQQRFFVNEMYAETTADGTKAKNAPNFLMIGGEGPESDTWVTNEKLAWMTYAKAVGANVYILEHRYYGTSKLKTTDLQYLTSAQMLYDVSRFIAIVKRDRSQTGPWITFGGSYPGALAAWSREWWPELILGAVGSSGPVLAKNDFFEYLQVVEKVLRAENQACGDRVQDAFDQLRKLSHDAAGRAQISKKFNLVPAWSANVNEIVPIENIQNVFGNLYGAFQDVVQYSDDNNKKGNDYTVRELCQIMTNETGFPNSMDAVREVQKWTRQDWGNPETGSDPYEDFKELRDMWRYIDGHADPDGTRPYSDGELASVLWTWQTCNEFGYYQTTDYGYGMFGSPVPLNFFVLMCEQVFGVGMDHIEKAVARSNYQYGGRARYSATNVVLPNGNHDPWHALGITEQGKLDKSVVPILIEGTAHCADMYAAADRDSEQLKNARVTILNNIKAWLGGKTPDGPTVAPPPTVTPFDVTTTSASSLSVIVAAMMPLLAALVL